MEMTTNSQPREIPSATSLVVASSVGEKLNSSPMAAMAVNNQAHGSSATSALSSSTTTSDVVDRVPSSGVIPLPHALTDSEGDATESSSSMTKQREQIKNLLVKNVRYEHLVAGVSGGVVSTLVCHPLDLIKVRFQVGSVISWHKR